MKILIPSLISLSTLLLAATPSQASWNIPGTNRCVGFGGDCPSLRRPSGGSSGSCLSVMSYPEEYSWYVKNSKSYAQTYYLNDKKYVISAGKTHYYTSKVGTYSSNSCSSGTRYRKPTIEFDRYSNDGKYTSKKFTVDVTNHRGFEFWKDGSTIRFSTVKNASR